MSTAILQRLLGFFLSLLICLSFFVATALPALASSVGVDVGEETISIFVSLYNDISYEFHVTNTQIKLSTGAKAGDALSALKDRELIADYTLVNRRDSSITSITLLDESILKTSPPPDSQVFYFKLNGVVQTPQLEHTTLQEGDILEIIYGKQIKTVIVPTESEGSAEAVASNITVSWNEKMQEILSDGCDYLNLTSDAEVEFLIAMGCAGRSPDIKKLNSALGAARRSSTTTSGAALANAILAMTFTGYDATEQVNRLSEIPIENGVATAVSVLMGYDSYSYPVDESAQNSRAVLVKYLMSMQNENGSFDSGSYGNLVSTTARVVTVLSRYRSYDGVATTIDRAVSFLAEQYVDGMGFESYGVPDSKLFSQVIIALISTELGIYDERFVSKVGEETLLDMLVEYRNPDGGFSVKSGETSNVDATIQAVVALSAVKKNKYPYTISQKLAPPTQTAGQLANKVKSLSIEDYVLLGIVATTVIAVIIISLISRFSKSSFKQSSFKRSNVKSD